MSIPKPTIVLVPGAWHPPTAFSPMTSILESAGYTCIPVTLASVGAEPPLEGFENDVKVIRDAVESQVSQEKDVIVVMHSYGSVPSGEAVKNLDQKSMRQNGKRGGIVALVYCCSFAPPEGSSLMDMLGGNPLPWFDISSDEKIVNPQTPKDIFYLDCSSESTEQAIASLKPHSYRTFFSKTTWEPWRDIPATYIYCTEDQAIPIEVQRGMVQGGGGDKIWKEETLQGASHSPFISVPEDTASVIRRVAGETV